MVYCTQQWMMIFCLEIMILFATTLAVLLVIGGVEKILDLVWRLRKLSKFCVVGVIDISRWQLNVTHVDAGFITAVVMVKDQWDRAGNGTVISAVRRDSDY